MNHYTRNGQGIKELTCELYYLYFDKKILV